MAVLRIAVLGAVLGLVACASTTDFKTPVDNFAAATNATAQALQGYDASAATRVVDERRADALTANTYVTMISCKTDTSTCDKAKKIDPGCNSYDDVCEVLVKSPSDQGPGCRHYRGQPVCRLSVSSVIPKEVALAKAIDQYAKGLQAIVATDVSGQVEAGLAKASTGICKLMSILGPAGGSCPVIAKPATEALSFGFRQYQEQVKLEALREATTKMDPWMYCTGTSSHKCVLQVLPTTASFLTESALPKLADNAVRARGDYVRNRPSTLDAWIAAIKAFNQARSAHREMNDVFKKMATAHHELTEALKPENVTVVEALVAINRFADAAEKVRKIAMEFKTATGANPLPAQS